MKILLPFLLISAATFALSEEFATLDHFDSSSTAVWNLESHQVELPLKVDRTQSDGLSQENESVLIGSGKDGAFTADTLSQWDLLSGSVANQVTLSGDRVYEFTSFTLPAGFTLKCAGSGALQIRVQGNVIIAGIIDMRGSTGAGGIGGTASCGGAAGGDGGVGGNGSRGSSAKNGIEGGGAGGVGSGNDGAGGGHINDGQDSGAASGGNSYDTFWADDLLGGSGGGGGAANGGTNGGGGGGGGGALRISTGGDLHTTSTGKILGNGGGGEVAAGAGDGGGGAGGEIVLFGGTRLINEGLIDISEGTGTTANGSFGTGWFTTRTPWTLADLLPGLDADGGNLSADDGRILYTASSSQILTLPYDTGLPDPHYTSFTAEETLSGGTIEYAIAGSDDNFQSDDTGFVSSNDLSMIQGKRYVKFRILLQGSSPTASPTVKKVSLNIFEPTFRYRAAACNAVHEGKDASQVFWLIYLLALPLGFKSMRRRRLAKASTVH